MDRKFSSFEDIDNQLEMLRVQRQLSLHRLRRQFSESPAQILKEQWVTNVRPALADMAIGWMLNRLREVRRKWRPELPQLH